MSSISLISLIQTFKTILCLLYLLISIWSRKYLVKSLILILIWWKAMIVMIKAIKASVLSVSNESCSSVLYKTTSAMKKIIISLLTMTTKTIVRITFSVLMNDSCHWCENQTILITLISNLMNKSLIPALLKALVNTYTTRMFISLWINYRLLHSLKISMSYKSLYQSVYVNQHCFNISLNLLRWNKNS